MRTLIITALLLASMPASAAEAYWTGQMRRHAGNLVACEYDAPTFTFWVTVQDFCPLTIRL